ncbi:UDP-N-acetylmuramoyl-tripeptide--D-alanyl-D-alanine ligase [Dokdonia sp. Hel_I_53]|uniref:UDP-N-acetylmuramoyl-tripeptide--D-alanyl-D- alanine ligase n=1 Tax=Dokdonia sp. Hel_I_53 TaxID=1566287 RepID=UPI0011994BEA|nr:UDP-N-acetylmuramoyl-tripeptide--D-alanyl-D-alanine ligase [Dokdonia sp. Hel_I_53]TVZ53134.1 UDP-N-acetylmuramoyl-tripeptide--D-alanyl-D-alanine ligase [Dokdonia sp. Hel_I_53]
MTIAELHFHFLNSTGVCTDTRTLKKGQIYFSLKGENFNGNKFAANAIKNGAILAIVDEKKDLAQKSVLVDDVLITLQKLAHYHRNYLNVPIIGLTGSNGKTTTKELINAVLSEKYRTVATQGNLNNHIGVPLTLLSMDETTEIGIVEMGANHQGEINMLSKIAEPNFGYITNFGKAHLEGFGGFQGVIKGKSELYDFMRKSDGIAFVNNTDSIQIEKSTGVKRITFGNSQSDCPISLTNSSGALEIKIEDTFIESNLIGSYNFSNIAAAISIGKYFDLETINIKNGIEKYIPENNRSQIISRDGYHIILDAYNANPTSMIAALENLDLQPTKNHIAFIGDMFEVGETSKEEHQNILDFAATLTINKLFAVGPDFGFSKKHKNQEVHCNYEAFSQSFSYRIPKDSTILIKGSRGMKMERVLELIK